MGLEPTPLGRNRIMDGVQRRQDRTSVLEHLSRVVKNVILTSASWRLRPLQTKTTTVAVRVPMQS